MLEFLKLDLSSNIAVFIILIMFFFSLFLIIKVKRLEDEINNLKFEDRSFFQKYVNNVCEDVVSVESLSKGDNLEKEDVLEKGSMFNNDVDMVKKDSVNIAENKKEVSIKIDTNGYSNNSSSEFLSDKLYDNRENIEKSSFNLDEFVKVSSFDKNKSSVVSSNTDYLNEISEKMAREIVPQTIELTDYEKDQEENAIISYKELLSVKDSNSVLEDEDFDFLEELKKLRNSLN